MNYSCLIVDDEVALSESTCEYFNMFDIETYWVKNEKECLDFFEINTADLVLLDINLGESSGFELCKILRKKLDIPILFISARTSDDDVLLALGIGGDDYIPKPYSLSVLLAKVKAVLKRYKMKEQSSEVLYSYIAFDDLKIDIQRQRLYKNEQEIKLKSMEYKLLLYLVDNKNRIVTKDELFDNVWKESFTCDSTLNVHIRRLREKIEQDPNNPLYIKTVWGKGYIFEMSN